MPDVSKILPSKACRACGLGREWEGRCHGDRCAMHLPQRTAAQQGRLRTRIVGGSRHSEASCVCESHHPEKKSGDPVWGIAFQSVCTGLRTQGLEEEGPGRTQSDEMRLSRLWGVTVRSLWLMLLPHAPPVHHGHTRARYLMFFARENYRTNTCDANRFKR